MQSRYPAEVALTEALPLASALVRADEEPLERQAPAPLRPTAGQHFFLETDKFTARPAADTAVEICFFTASTHSALTVGKIMSS